jgi:hypothetical protein
VTEQELRTLVREAIARSGDPASRPPALPAPAFFHLHASHGMFSLPVGIDSDGPCIIEPAVACNHCGYCKSYGH